MFIFLVVLILLIAVLLSIVVMLQSGKGGGLSGIAGGQTTQILGARQAPDLLEKATWVLGSLFLFLSILTTFFTADPVVQTPRPSSRPQRKRSPPVHAAARHAGRTRPRGPRRDAQRAPGLWRRCPATEAPSE